MGYRSEVKIATTQEGYERICRRVDELSIDHNCHPLIGEAIAPENFEQADGCVVFGWDFIKWYDTYLDVINVTTALGELADEGIPYEFCRIGENWDDIEFSNCDDDGVLALHIEPDVTIGIYG